MATRQPLRRLTLNLMAFTKERLGHVAASHRHKISMRIPFSLNLSEKEEGPVAMATDKYNNQAAISIVIVTEKFNLIDNICCSLIAEITG